MKKIALTILFIQSILFQCTAQREANVWYFGIHAGIDFNTGTAIPLEDGKINRWEGVATFSDSLGNLLFYTDGDSVWNRNHEAMENGFGLLGDPSSTESAIIVPYPAHDSLYYIFTIDEEGGDDGFCYSVVNMKKAGGLGAVTTKNIQLVSPVSEKITAVRHKNNVDFWIITHGWETDSFFVYRMTPSGLDPTPTITEIGIHHADIGIHGNNAVGYMRIAPDGSKLALAIQVSQIFELLDFNNETGELSNPIDIPQSKGSPYGVEFSPDISKLFMTSGKYLFQADLTSDDPSDIINSIIMIDSSDNNNFFGAIQLATDGKIYLAHDFNNYLGVVNSPSKYANECDFELKGLYLSGKQSRMGLPNFIQTYFLPPDIQCLNFCFGDSTKFFLHETLGIDSVVWNFDDPTSDNNISKIFKPFHIFTKPGFFNIKLDIWKNNIVYHKNRIIRINNLPNFSFPCADTLICMGDSIFLDATTDSCMYLWNNLSVDSVLWAKKNGIYSVKLTHKYTNCSTRDSILLKLSPLPKFTIGKDSGFCKNDSILLSVNYPKADFLWNTGDTTNSIYVKIAGKYSLKITDSVKCTNSDTINIQEYLLPELWLGNDTIICPNTIIRLSPQTNDSLFWSDNSTENFIDITKPGVYWAEITDKNNCKNNDTIVINHKDLPTILLGADTTLCENEILELTINKPDYNFLWSDGSINNSLIISYPGTYSLQASNICGSAADTIYVKYKYCGEIYIPNIFTPNDDGINDFFKIKGIEEDEWRLQIFNRWGQLIFSTPSYNNNWQGKNCSDGTYYYILDNPQLNTIFSGHVRIYR